MQKPGEVFEVDGIWYVIVDQGKRLPERPVKVYPQPANVSEEYIHDDGTVHVCKNLRCPNLVPKSKNIGIEKIFCSRRCMRLTAQRKHDAVRGSGRVEQRDVQGRLYAVIKRKGATVERARKSMEEHLDGLKDRCPEANQISNFHCPGRFNPNCMSLDKWSRWRETGPWPGACLIYATLKDHYKTLYYAERATEAERMYTVGRGEEWRWRDEGEMLPC